MFSLAVFLIGSIGSSLAWNVGSLIGWRVVQGFGGGLMLPLMTTLIFQAAGGKSLGKLVTYVALPALLGPILGPLIGGAILTHLSWRFMFWVNVPFCTVGLLLAWRYLASDAPARPDPAQRPGLDVPGLFLLAPGTVAILLGLANAGTSGGFGHPGVMLVPQGIGAILSRTVAGSKIDKYGSRRIAVIGFAIVAASTVPFALAGPQTSEWPLALWMAIRGFGLGCVTMPVMVAGYIGLDKQQIPHSSVLTRMSQQIGGSFGTAVLAVILEAAIVSHHGAPAGAFHIAFWWSVGFSAVAVLLSLWLPGAQRPQPAESAPAPQPALAADRH
jgi:MFS family permease